MGIMGSEIGISFLVMMIGLGLDFGILALLALFGPGILLRLFSLVISCVLTCFYRQLVMEHQR